MAKPPEKLFSLFHCPWSPIKPWQQRTDNWFFCTGYTTHSNHYIAATCRHFAEIHWQHPVAFTVAVLVNITLETNLRTHTDHELLSTKICK